MKRFILIMILLLPVVALAQPSIVFEELSHDFGEVQEGEQLEYVFDFSNKGTEELVIKRLKTT